jgi:hypothetical protein
MKGGLVLRAGRVIFQKGEVTMRKLGLFKVTLGIDEPENQSDFSYSTVVLARDAVDAIKKLLIGKKEYVTSVSLLGRED